MSDYNNRVKIVEDNSFSKVWNTTTFNESKFAEKTQQFILNSSIPLSNQRDNQVVSNNGSILKQASEYRLRASTDSGSIALLESAQRGNYISGNEAEAGMGVRIPVQPTGDAFVRWGYFKKNNGDVTGFYFRYDKDGLWVVIEDEGVIVHEKKQSEWNSHTFSNELGFGELEPSEGNIYQIAFAYYGYGAITWQVSNQISYDRFNVIPVHKKKIKGATSISEPNLPISIEVNSGTTGVELDAYIAGRQFSTYGKETPVERSVGDYRIEQSGVSTTLVPTVSFKEKEGFKNILVTLSNISFLSDSDMVYEIRVNADLTGADFGIPDGYLDSEVATQWDTSATAMTGGESIKVGLIEGGNRTNLTFNELPERPVFEDSVFTVGVKRLSGTNGTVTSSFEVKEVW